MQLYITVERQARPISVRIMSALSTGPNSHNPHLVEAIAQRIIASPDRRISFAEYMDLALYHPQYGYYTVYRSKIGAGGDFFTSPHLAADFGEILAEQFVEMWERLGCPHPFTLLEMGAGQGLLVKDVLHHLHRHHTPCFEAVQYFVVETSPAFVAEQQWRSQSLPYPEKLRWCTWDDIPAQSIIGCCFSNELVDAFPVHQVLFKEGRLHEIYVTLFEAKPPSLEQPKSLEFGEVLGDLSTPALADYFQLNGIAFSSPPYPDGYRTEVNLAALDWMKRVSDRLHQGYVLTIDYGYPAHRYYSPTRAEGTLQCYYQHAHHSNPYVYIGQQDITAHVDFTALERQGEQSGLQTLGFTQQGLFLMALGLGDRIAALSTLSVSEQQSLNDILRRRDALHALINPMGLGNFGVLLQSKGIPFSSASEPLKGLRY